MVKRHIADRKQGWRSGESARLPPMWPRFDSLCRLSLLLVIACSEGLTQGFLVFLYPQKPTFPNFNSTGIEDPHENELRLTGDSSLNNVIYLTHFIPFSFRRNSWETIFSKSTEVISMVIKLCINCQSLYTFSILSSWFAFFFLKVSYEKSFVHQDNLSLLMNFHIPIIRLLGIVLIL